MLKLKITATLMASTAILLAGYCIYKEQQYPDIFPSQNTIETSVRCSTQTENPKDTFPILPESPKE